MDEDAAIVGLADMVHALRDELSTALEAGADETLRFQLGTAELEVSLVVVREAGGEGGVRFGVVSVGAKGGLSSERTHRLRLSLQPVTISGDGKASTALISGWLPQEPR